MRAILINPTGKAISTVNYDGNFRSIYRLLGCDTFTTLQVSPQTTLFLDDEGLLKANPGPFFAWKGYPQPLAGNGLLLDTDEVGESVACTMALADVVASVSWVAPVFKGFRDTSGVEDHPLLGSVTVMRREALFDNDTAGDTAGKVEE